MFAATKLIFAGTAAPPPAASWTLDFSTGEPWSNGTDYVFSGTASTSRTFINTSGFIDNGIANLVRFSESMGGGNWNSLGLVGTNNITTAPDGATTATRWAEASGTSSWYATSPTFQSTTGVDFTVSVYAKADTNTVFQIVGNSGQFGLNEWATFDVANGTIGTVGTAVTGSDATIESIGSGWYRCKLTMTATATIGSAQIWFAFTNNNASATRAPSYSGNGSSRLMYLWGAQIVQGTSSALPYSKTTTSSNAIPRLTNNSSGSRLGLLVEGQRTNYCLQSNSIATSPWIPIGTTLGTSIAAPDNTTTGARVVETATVNRHARSAGVTVGSANVATTFSIYLKKDTRQYVTIQLNLGGMRYSAIFDLNAGSVTDTLATNGPTNTSSTITSVGNQWFRASVRATMNSTIGNILVGTSAASTFGAQTLNADTPSFLGSTSEGFYMWGGQLEHSASATSLIPTTTATVTRQADIAYAETAKVTNWGRPGSFVVEYYKPGEQTGTVVVADDDGAGNAGRLGVDYSSGGPRIVYGTASAGSGGTDVAGLNKIGWAWNGSGAATRSALNGAALDSSLPTSFDPTLTDGINLGGNIDWSTLPLTVTGQPNLIIRRVRFWNSQLSASQLNSLTL